ncbi:zinc ribbon domain-containing protein [Sphingomonas sp.]|uniref:zinc ribbon domain-containing protein n=1 Tax=Sphingomonas sp. TaxID=28214 RepID=UPI003B002453
MAFCTECGAAVPVGAKFCPECGKPVAIDAAAVVTSPGPTPPPPVQVPQPVAQSPIHPATQATPHFGPQFTPQLARPASGGGGAIWILPVLVFVAMVAVAYVFLMRRDRAPTSAAPTAVTATAVDRDGLSVPTTHTMPTGATVTATTLDSAFSIDPAGAALRYTGPIAVTGLIASMVQPGATPSLSMEGRNRFNYMVVSFPTGYGPRLATLSRGLTITVACDQVRSLAGTTMLSGCRLP